jgi:hypothetical protein
MPRLPTTDEQDGLHAISRGARLRKGYTTRTSKGAITACLTFRTAGVER